MGIAITTTITCDCCGIACVPNGASPGYVEIRHGYDVVVVLCTAKNCASSILTDLVTWLGTQSTVHQATTILGVIINHP